MYCPRCAVENVDTVHFCRACGTDLRPVALALSGAPGAAPARKGKGKKTKSAVEKRIEGVRNVTTGSMLFLVSVLIGVALAMFVPGNAWMLIWLVFVGWVAVWGAMALGAGIGDLLEAKILAGQGEPQGGLPPEPQPVRLLSPSEPVDARRADASPHSYEPPSVTEHTTRNFERRDTDAT